MRKIFFVIMATILIFASSSEAAKIDMYRDALINKNFTLKYEISKVPVYSSMRSGTLTFEGTLQNRNTQTVSDILHGGIIVVSGDNRYIETHHAGYETKSADFSKLTNAARNNLGVNAQSKTIKIPESGDCTLLKDGEVFQFIWAKDGDKLKYKGMVQKNMLGMKYLDFKSGEIRANVNTYKTPYQDLIEEFNYGIPEMSLILMPLLPREKIIATNWTPDYKFFGSGTLANGLTYEDFVSDKNNLYSAIRYYFKGDNMVKVAVASYFKNGNKIQSYVKKVIDITEFVPSADQNYLKLPESLKDVTKRDEEASK